MTTILLCVHIFEVFFRPLVAEPVRYIGAIAFSRGFDVIVLHLLLGKLKRLAVNIAEAVDHVLAGVHDIPGKRHILKAKRLDILGDTLLHVAAGQSFGIVAHTLHRGGHHFIIAHCHRVFPRGLFGFLLGSLPGLPLGFPFGLSLLMLLPLTILFRLFLGFRIRGGRGGIRILLHLRKQRLRLLLLSLLPVVCPFGRQLCGVLYRRASILYIIPQVCGHF